MRFKSVFLMLITIVSICLSAYAFAQALTVVENEVAATQNQETTPTLGTD